jgi:hypothetical protein
VPEIVKGAPGMICKRSPTKIGEVLYIKEVTGIQLRFQYCVGLKQGCIRAEIAGAIEKDYPNHCTAYHEVEPQRIEVPA